MRRPVVYSPMGLAVQTMLMVMVLLALTALVLELYRTAFTKIGFSWNDAAYLLLASYFGGHINLPVATLRSEEPVMASQLVRMWGVVYRIPVQAVSHSATVVAVNVGGCVIPVAVAVYLLARFPAAIPSLIAGATVVAALVHRVARPVPGLGIVTPFLLPPLSAAIVTIVLTGLFDGSPSTRFVVAYISGTMGALIGADLMNLGRIRDLRAPVASIGGAGTFDGIFITGIFAVLLV